MGPDLLTKCNQFNKADGRLSVYGPGLFLGTGKFPSHQPLPLPEHTDSITPSLPSSFPRGATGLQSRWAVAQSRLAILALAGWNTLVAS